MAPRLNDCDTVRLELFLRDRLPDGPRRQVEDHVLACAACQEKLDTLAGGARWWTEVRRYLGGDGADLGLRTQPTLAPPERLGADLAFLQPANDSTALGMLGPYLVQEVIGQGGMGMVLKAFDPSLNRPVAVKVLAAEYAANGPARKRFVREAQAAAAVAHDHVVPVHAVNAEHTPPYLVMAFIPGQSLQQRIDATGPLQLREILRIGMQTAAGLAAAHAQGLVHRDIKPANIMLENGIERVRITDFGLARAVDDATLSISGAVAGTPQYMAPEQAEGALIDQRADLFSLGSTLYAMCTGLAPFRAASAAAALRQVCDAEPRPLRTLNPDIPAWLAGIIARLLAKDPVKRFQSAAEVAALLEQCLAHVQQPDQHPLPRLAKELARNVPGPRPRPNRHGRRLIVAVAVLLVLLAAPLLYFTRPTSSVDVARAPARPEPSGPRLGKDAFDARAAELQHEIVRLQQSFEADATPGPSKLDAELAAARASVAALSRSMDTDAAAAVDPVWVEIESIRARLRLLAQSEQLFDATLPKGGNP